MNKVVDDAKIPQPLFSMIIALIIALLCMLL